MKLCGAFISLESVPEALLLFMVYINNPLLVILLNESFLHHILMAEEGKEAFYIS